MFAVIFVVQPKPDRFEDYLALAKELKPKLEATAGFIDNERFESKRTEGRILSLSTWRDEKSVVRWRSHGEHHGVQEKGRFEVFADYHLRVGEITSDTHPPHGAMLAENRFDETEIGAARAVTISEVTPQRGSDLATNPNLLAARLGLASDADGVVAEETFESIYNPGKLLLLVSWRVADTAATWSPRQSDAAPTIRHRRVRVIRDYGLFERREAPQFFPAVKAVGSRTERPPRSAAG
jgi:heme-degrading monooxygenase HmoA